MPIPYMGSKRKSAQKIYQAIVNFNPEKGLLVDLFCGGFAISEKFLDNGWKIIANDKNTYVIELLRKTIIEGLPEDICTKFISRETFIDISNHPEKYEAWYVGYAQCCWSFGNNQKNYIFGKDIESIKYAGHKLVIDKDPSKLKGLIPRKYIDGILNQSDWHKRRIALVKVFVALQNRKLELQQLERLEQLQLFNESYNDVMIPKGSIIYCDPPYAGTSEYKEGSFNHAEFWEWCRKVSKTNKIYISEYFAPKDFEPLLSFSQKSTLQGGSQQHNNQPKERLFIPIGQEKFKKEVTNG